MTNYPDRGGNFDIPFPQIVTNSDAWLAVGHFIYPGSNAVGSPVDGCVIAGVVNAGAVCGVRIYDHTNAKLIAEKLDITAQNPTCIDLPAFVNVPEDGMVIWELQVKRVSGVGTKKVAAGSLTLRY